MSGPRDPRYWRIHPAPAPGGVIAEHDGGVGLDEPGLSDDGLVSGPGHYTVTVRRRGKTIATGDIEGTRVWPIELESVHRLDPPLRFNPGMARWFGLRLIEAAAIAEVMNADATIPFQALDEVQRLANWMDQNAADWIGDGAAVDDAIRLMAHAKRLVARQDGEMHAEEAKPPNTDDDGPTTEGERRLSLKDLAIARLREAARKVIDEQSATAAMEFNAVRREALAAGLVTEAEIRKVVGYFTPNEQTIIRGRIGL